MVQHKGVRGRRPALPWARVCGDALANGAAVRCLPARPAESWGRAGAAQPGLARALRVGFRRRSVLLWGFLHAVLSSVRKDGFAPPSPPLLSFHGWGFPGVLGGSRGPWGAACGVSRVTCARGCCWARLRCCPPRGVASLRPAPCVCGECHEGPSLGCPGESGPALLGQSPRLMTAHLTPVAGSAMPASRPGSASEASGSPPVSASRPCWCPRSWWLTALLCAASPGVGSGGAALPSTPGLRAHPLQLPAVQVLPERG